MEDPNKTKGQNKKLTELTTIPVPFDSLNIINDFSISTNSKSKYAKERIINQALKFHSQGNISEAAKYYQYFIDQGFEDPRVFCNYGIICRRQGSKELAKKLYLKSIKLYPNHSDSYSNLGFLLKQDNQIEEAHKYTIKAIELK